MNKEEFIKCLNELNISVDNTILEKLNIYLDLLIDYNNKFNLTSIKTEKEIYLKHFYDSLCIFKSNKIKDNITLCDIGTGAGFPGVIIAIFNKNIKVDLIESNNKKCMFLNIIIEKLELNNINVYNKRAEDYAKKEREKYDIVTSRAVANLKILLELSIPLLKVNGYFLPMKSNVTEEMEKSKETFKLLDSKIENIIEYKLPIENSKRTILEIKKIKETNKKYPRNYNIIKKDAKK